MNRVSSRFLLVCSHFFEFQNEAWPSLDQLNGMCGAPPTFHLIPLIFEYSARQKCILSLGGDCICSNQRWAVPTPESESEPEPAPKFTDLEPESE